MGSAEGGGRPPENELMALLLEQHADASMCCKTLNLLIDHLPHGLFSCSVLFSPTKSESRFENDMNCFSKGGSVPHTLLRVKKLAQMNATYPLLHVLT